MCKLGVTFCCFIDPHITIDLLRFRWKGRRLFGEKPSNSINTMVSMFFSLYQHRLLITVKSQPAVTWAAWRMDRRSWSWGHVTPAWGELCHDIHFILKQQTEIQRSQHLVKLVWQGLQCWFDMSVTVPTAKLMISSSKISSRLVVDATNVNEICHSALFPS